jgi:chromate reductase
MLLREAKDLVNRNLAYIEIFEIANLPLFSQDLELNPPIAVQELKRAITEADAILLATPEYNYSTSGVLKNTIDWGSRPYGDNSWAGKPVAIMGASIGGFGTIRAQLHLRQMFLFLNMHPVDNPEVYVSKADSKFNEKGELTDEDIREKIVNLLDALVNKTRLIKGISC